MLDPQKSKLAGGRQSVGPFAQFGVVQEAPLPFRWDRCAPVAGAESFCVPDRGPSVVAALGLVASSPVTAQRVHLRAPPLD